MHKKLDNPEVMVPLNALISEARKNKLWIWCHYQDLWFSPDGLEQANKEGRFRWGTINWKLRDPQERLQEAQNRTARAKADEERIAAEIMK